MTGKFARVCLLTCAALLAACGTVATPVWEATDVEVEDAEVEAAVLLEPTAVPPTATPIPPSATPIPPTATPIPATATPAPPTATIEPTQVPATEAAPADDVSELEAAVAAADPANGQVIFNTFYDQAAFMCSTCHSVTEDEIRLIGPGLYNIGERAVTRVEGQSAVEYLYNSIVHPNDFIAPAREGEAEYPANLMPQVYGEILTEQELYDLVAYLLTLGA